ncbi:MAG: hypothetical protein ACLTZB_05450 [Streptococcus salivarius]
MHRHDVLEVGYTAILT